MIDSHEGWAQLPGASETKGAAPGSPLGRFLVAAMTVGLIPVVAGWPAATAASNLATITIIAAAALLAVAGAERSRRWWVPHLAFGGAAAGVAAVTTWAAGVATALMGVVACWSVLDRRPSSVPAVDPAARLQITGVTALAAIVAGQVEWFGPIPAAAVVVAVVVMSVRHPGTFATVRKAVDAVVARIVGVGVGLVVAVVGVVLVLMPWVAQRLVRWDPTWFPRPTGSRWVPVGRGAPAPRNLWDRDPRLVRSTPGRRAHRVAVTLVGVAALIGAVGGSLWITQIRSENQRYSSAALADSPWWPAMSDAIDIAYGRSPISSYAGVMMVDSRYPGFNVTDGVRRTWTPPPSSCDPVTVWMFGGSTMFGLGQRDDHTIASELARVAWQEGIPLEIENRGVPADTFWMETRRIEVALAEGSPPPDLVIFYDGANDFRVQAQLNATGRGGERVFANDLDWQALRDIERRNNRIATLMEIARDGPVILPEAGRTLSAVEIGEFASRGYAANSERIRPFLAAQGIAEAHFYQPSRVTRDVPFDDEPPPDRGNEDFQKQIEGSFRAHLPAGVIDISDAMDGTDRAVYYDELHTNEFGARLVAEAMWTHLEEGLRARFEPGAGACR